MKSKHYFKQFDKDIKEQHKKFKTHLEETEISTKKCTHYGKVSIRNGELRCTCGAGWSGPNIEVLFDTFNKK